MALESNIWTYGCHVLAREEDQAILILDAGTDGYLIPLQAERDTSLICLISEIDHGNRFSQF